MRVSTKVIFTAAVAITDLLSTQASAADAATSDTRSMQLEEVVVTATKREERLQDVPIAMSAVTGAQLQDMGAQSLKDYILTVPGVAFNSWQPGVSEVVIRGISASTYHEQNQTVIGYYLNEIPLNEAGWPIAIPDIDTFDLERVEVLRGPQGTLFGAASLGGLINYIAKPADTSGWDAAAEAMYGHTENSSHNDHAVKGMVNIPLLADKLALRVTAINRFDGGFLNDRVFHLKGSNDLKTTGGRFSAVFTPVEGTKLSWLTMLQQTNSADQNYGYIGTLNRANFFFEEPQYTSMLINSLRLDQDVGIGTLTALVAHTQKHGHLTFDVTDNAYLQATATNSPDHTLAKADHYEVRLASKGDGRIGWLIGAAHYSSRKDLHDEVYQAGASAFIDANPGSFGGYPGSLLAPDDVLNRYRTHQTNRDYGVFGELSLKLTSQLTLSGGGRYYKAKSDTTVARPPSASYLDSFDAVGSSYEQKQESSGFTPKVTLSYKPYEGLMTYASYSTGFRVGGANPNPPGFIDAPLGYKSDSMKNYEVGVRTDLFNRRLVLDLTAFHIDWKDIQVRLFTPAPFYYSYVTNAGGAKVDGIESAITWRIVPTLSLVSSATYEHARVSTFVPDTFAANGNGGYSRGTILPGSAKWQLASTVSWLPAGVPLSPRVEGSYSFTSKAPVAWDSITQRGGFPTFDARVAINPRQDLTVSLFVDNMFNRLGTLSAPFADYDVAANLPPRGTVNRPRSFGVRFNWNMPH